MPVIEFSYNSQRRIPLAQHGSCRRFILAIAAVSSTVLSADQSDIPCEPRVITDTTVIRNAGYRHAFNADGGEEFRACLRKDGHLTLCVFRNGIQIGELDSAQTRTFLAQDPSFQPVHSPESTSVAQRPSRARAAQLWGSESFLATLRNQDIDRRQKIRAIVALGNWRPGMTIGDRFEMAGSTVLVMRNNFDCNGIVKLSFFYAGAGFSATKFYGQTADLLYKEKGSRFRNSSFFLTFGVPFIRYQIQTAAWMVPEYFWLEEDMVAIMNGETDGSTLADAQWKWGAAHLDNLTHALYFRLGHLYMDLVFDRQIYRGPIVKLGLNDLPSIAGTWGMSLTKAADVVIPGLWINLPQITTNKISFQTRRFPLAIEPLRVHFNYWNLQRYNYGLTVRAHIGYQRLTRSDHEQK